MALDNHLAMTPMGRRIALVFGLVVLAMILLSVWMTGAKIESRLRLEAEARMADAARGYASQLQSRLLAVDSLVEMASVGEAGSGGALLRQKVMRSSAIRSAVVFGVAEAYPEGTRAPLRLDEAARATLNAGGTLLRSVCVERARCALYVMRLTTLKGAPAVAYFEIAPDWLWSGLGADARAGMLVVIDGDGAQLATSADIPVLLLARFAREQEESVESRSLPIARTWQAEGREWRGTAMPLQLTQVRMAAPRWSIIAFDTVHADGIALMAGNLPWLLLLGALLVVVASWLVQRRWHPVLVEVGRALAMLGEGRFQRVALDSSADAPRATAVAFNRAVDVLEERMLTQGSLAEIDRLLLEGGQLEQALEAVLVRVCRTSRCQGAEIALLEEDAPGCARAYVASADGSTRPVSRIVVDAGMIESLSAHPEGVTVARCEPGRHSVIEPLDTLGADFFWVWPVHTQQRIAAVLAIGYRGAPSVPAEVASFGTQCAQRLAVRLSNSVRDEQLYRQAHFDALTALPNRLLFRDRLSQELASATEGAQRGALMYIDLDHFKKVNDTLGHSAGDQLLTVVAQRLRSCVKDGDTVARLAGDEFTMILRNVSGAEAVQQVVARVIDTLRQPVHIAGQDHSVRASIGVTLFPDDGTAIEELMRNADLAMYQAKDSGRAQAVFFDLKMTRGAGHSDDSGLFRALRQREFSLYYQPQYSLSDGRLMGLEALLRWQPPRESTRYPAEFIPAAEHNGLIIDIGAWVLETVCNQLAIWREQGIAPPQLALNVSLQQLRKSEFPVLVRRALDRVGLPPELLEIEVTEKVFADDEACQSLRRLNALGVRLALDDFGTGDSSLGSLRRHPVQIIKIDRSFIQELPQSYTAATLTETIIAMAHALGKQVVAEGVESLEQLEFLRERGCDAAQGFFLGHPRSVTEIAELLNARHCAAASLEVRATG